MIYGIFRRQFFIDIPEFLSDIASQFRVQQILSAGKFRIAEVDIAVGGIADNQFLYKGFLRDVLLYERFVRRIIIR